MKLILKSSSLGKKSTNGVKIGKTSISITPKLKLMGIDYNWFGAFGYDDKMNLSLFLSEKRQPGFFKLTTSGNNKSKNLYISISNRNREVMSDFIGEYRFTDRYKKDDILIINLEKIQISDE